MAVTTFTPPGGDASRINVPDSVASGGRVKLVLYCHGVGGSETEFGHADYSALRAWMDSNGWGWVEAKAGGAGWGNTFQRQAYSAALAHAVNLYNVTDVVVIARSMGGMVGSWLHLHDPVVAPLSRGLIACSPVQSVMDMYDHTTLTSFRTSIRAAYGTATRAETEAATLGHDPIRFPTSDYAGTSVLWQYGTADDIVNSTNNAVAQRARVASGLALSLTDEEVGGDHYTTRTRSTAHTAFLAAVAPTLVEDGIYRRAVAGSRSVVGDDGLLYPITG